jgi:hypothetical protein
MKTKKLEKHLLEGKSITKLEALLKFGVWNTGDVIFKMRKRGINIETKMIKQKDKTFARYKLKN